MIKAAESAMSMSCASSAQQAIRELKCSQAINEAIDLSMAFDPSVYVVGLGVPDPKGIFGTTLGLQQKYGEKRVMDMPTSENGMTGIAIGSALVGMRPVMVHLRLEFALLAVEQIVNQAANWHYMYGGQAKIPLVIRLIVGRGWGQGPQHSQSLHSWFAHIPGLKVVVPATPYDAKGLLISSIEDNNPVLFIEHRWVHGVSGHVPEGLYRVPLGKSRVVKQGTDITIAAISYMTLEAVRAAQILDSHGISMEVIDIRSLRPYDGTTILESVRKTRSLIVADTDWQTVGFSAEVIAQISETDPHIFHRAPVRITPPPAPSPSTPGLSRYYYPRARHIIETASRMLGRSLPDRWDSDLNEDVLDVPDPGFTGPF